MPECSKCGKEVGGRSAYSSICYDCNNGDIDEGNKKFGISLFCKKCHEYVTFKYDYGEYCCPLCKISQKDNEEMPLGNVYPGYKNKH